MMVYHIVCFTVCINANKPKNIYLKFNVQLNINYINLNICSLGFQHLVASVDIGFIIRLADEC